MLDYYQLKVQYVTIKGNYLQNLRIEVTSWRCDIYVLLLLLLLLWVFTCDGSVGDVWVIWCDEGRWVSEAQCVMLKMVDMVKSRGNRIVGWAELGLQLTWELHCYSFCSIAYQPPMAVFWVQHNAAILETARPRSSCDNYIITQNFGYTMWNKYNNKQTKG